MKDQIQWATDRTLTREVLTIGYEGSEIQEFVQRLISASVETLVDVRDLPASRKRGFSKNKLREHLEVAGINYIHLKSLGDPREGRIAARAGEHDRFVRIFSTHMKTEDAQLGLHELVKIVESTRACLMCFERHHSGCHRKIVVEQLAQLIDVKVSHIAVPDRSRGDVTRCSNH